MKVKRKKQSSKSQVGKHKFIYIFAIIGLLVSPAIFGQNTPVLGWKTHFSYDHVRQLSLGSNQLYAATENTIFTIDREEGSVERLNKINGLSDVGIGAIQLLNDGETLIIGYNNGNIDIVTPSSVNNITTVLDFETTQSKHFSSIQIDGQLVYMAGGLGIIVYDQNQNEIREAYQNLGPGGSPLAINSVKVFNDSIFAATDNGLMAASLTSTINRQDYNNWERSLEGIRFEHLAITDFGFFASSENDLFLRQGDDWIFYQNFSNTISSLESLGNELLVVTTSEIISLTESDQTTIYTLDNSSFNINTVLSEGSFLWIATEGMGLLKLARGTTDPAPFNINGPSVDISYKAQRFGKNIYTVPSSFTNLNEEHTLNWHDYSQNEWNSPSIVTTSNTPIGQIIDALELNQETYFASFNQGLFKLDGSQALIGPSSGPESIDNSFNLSSITPDENGLIWTTFYDRSNSIFTYDPSNDSWQNHSPDYPLARFSTDLFIGPNGDKWLTVAPEEGGGIVVFNESSNRERYLNRNGGQGGIPSNEVTDIELDQDFFVWVSTSQGVAFFTNPFTILEGGSLTASVPIYENRLLLRNEYITDMAIDPANRKWFGTRNNGIWLFSSSGEELIYHFTSDNSPLPSNLILSIAIEPQSGELLITTDKGAIAFRSDATEGTDTHQNVKVYPNPVSPGFNGQIVIEGLVNNAQIKVTDISGKLVKEIRANGSTAIWNGRDLNNSRVKSGVYLVFSASSDGLETYVTKIVVI